MLLMSVRHFEKSFVGFPALSVGCRNKEDVVRSEQSIDYNSVDTLRKKEGKITRALEGSKLWLCGLSSLDFCA